VTRSLIALSLTLFALAAPASTIPVAPRDLTADIFTGHGRPVLSLATNGNTFLLAWEDRVLPIYDSSARIYVRTYDANGQQEQPLPVPISGAISPAAVWSGREWVIGSNGYTSRFDPFPAARLYATRVNEHATESDALVELSSTPNAPNGRVGAVTNGNDIFIGNAGNAVVTTSDLQPRVKLAQPLRPLAAADGTFLAQGSGSAVVLSRDGAVLQNIATSNTIAGTSGGNEYAIVYVTGTSVEALTTGTDGAILNRTTLETNISATTPAVIRRGDSYLAAWVSGGRNICFATFNASTKSAVQCHETGLVQSLGLADNGTGTLVAWSVTSSAYNETDRLFTSFGPSSVLPQLAQPADAATMLRLQADPHLAQDRNGVTAVWSDGRVPYIGGLDRGAMQARVPRPVMLQTEHLYNLRLSRSRNAALVLWSALLASGKSEVRVSIIPDDGSPQMNLTLPGAKTADVASDGDHWLAVWLSDEQSPQVLTTIITAQGIAVSPDGTPLVPSTSAQAGVAVASRGSDYLVAWTENGPTSGLLKAIGMSSGGTPSGGTMTLAGGPIPGVSISASGRLYLIVVQAPNIGFPVTSIVPDILVAGVPEGPVNVKPRDGGFAVLHGSPLRATFVDALGNHSDGGVLPFDSYYAFDFLYDGPRLVLARVAPDGWSSQVLLDLYDPRVRVTGRR
jgi:hypothetical protein